jgi:ribosome-binding factor A
VSDRMRRVDEAVREVLSDAISRQVKDPRVGFVTVTAVETASDLRHARVFVSVLGDAGVRRRSLEGLQSAHGVLQRVVARELRLKHTPELEFVYDDTTDRAERVTRLIASEAVGRAKPETGQGGRA